MNRRVVKLVILFALLHYITVLCVGGLIFLISHVPPKAIDLDGVIRALFNLELVLTAARKLLLWLYPGEATPGWLGIVTAILSSALWGAGLTSLKMLWQKVTA
jgi:hypothetical protein